MMVKYRIGKIEHRWQNMVPPIQGGVFRALSDAESCTDGDGDADDVENALIGDSPNSSHMSSQASSTVFDFADQETGDDPASLRGRKGRGGAVSGISSSSATSVGESDVSMDAMSVLDRRTMQEIKQDLDIYPSLDAETQDTIVAKYRQLNERIRAEGLYQCNYFAYAIECLRYTLFFSLFLFFLHWKWYATSGFWLGCFWHQLVFTAHDAGHMGITHRFHVDTVIGIIIADFLGGLSLGWWKRVSCHYTSQPSFRKFLLTDFLAESQRSSHCHKLT